jgi:hypothetical protein
MAFTAKVKQTGKIFEATDELDKNGDRTFDAQSLADGKSYKGFLYDTQPTDDPAKFRYKSRTEATFKAEEIERMPLPLTLKAIRKPT